MKYFKYGSDYSKITCSMMEKAIKEVYADGLRSQQVVTKDGVSTTTKYIWGNNGLAAVITDERTVVLRCR